jgi:hypothetical protein
MPFYRWAPDEIFSDKVKPESEIQKPNDEEFSRAGSFKYDKKLHVQAQSEWEETIRSYRPIGSILWPSEPMFSLVPEAESPVFRLEYHSHAGRQQPNISGKTI